MRMTFRGFEYIEVETLKTPETEIWYQDLKDVPSIELPERALVAARMSLHWRMNRHDKPVYMEDDKGEEIEKMTIVQKGADEASWYHQIIKNIVLPKDLTAQPSAGASPEKKKKCIPVVSVAPKKADVPREKIVREEKKGTRPLLKPWCDYVVVSDTLEDLAPVFVKKPKPEPQDTVDVPTSNPDEPIDLDLSAEPLVRTKAVKRKKSGS
ncbi:hypothetical protein Hanom_Chr16g01426651 [Helianthus anomalus]